MGKRVLLVSPPIDEISQIVYFLMPLGLLSIAAYLQTLGYETQVLDANVMIRNLDCKTDDALMELVCHSILEFKPAMLGVSVMGASQIEMALATIEMAKHVDANIVTVLGGAHASQFAIKILEKCLALDYVVLGEGELQSAWIAQNIVSHRSSGVMPDGIAYRNGSEVQFNPKRTFITSVDSLPTPAYRACCTSLKLSNNLNQQKMESGCFCVL